MATYEARRFAVTWLTNAARVTPRNPLIAARALAALDWRRRLRHIELCEGGAQRVEARGVWEPVFVDEASGSPLLV